MLSSDDTCRPLAMCIFATHVMHVVLSRCTLSSRDVCSPHTMHVVLSRCMLSPRVAFRPLVIYAFVRHAMYVVLMQCISSSRKVCFPHALQGVLTRCMLSSCNAYRLLAKYVFPTRCKASSHDVCCPHTMHIVLSQSMFSPRAAWRPHAMYVVLMQCMVSLTLHIVFSQSMFSPRVARRPHAMYVSKGGAVLIRMKYRRCFAKLVALLVPTALSQWLQSSRDCIPLDPLCNPISKLLRSKSCISRPRVVQRPWSNLILLQSFYIWYVRIFPQVLQDNANRVLPSLRWLHAVSDPGPLGKSVTKIFKMAA